MVKELLTLLDEDGRLKRWPAKHAMKELASEYLASKFEPGVLYTEKEVNTVISQWHTFNDYFLLRRTLVEKGLLERKPNGSQYWKKQA